MKRWFALFELTVTEQRIVLLLLLAIVAATAIKRRHEARETNILSSPGLIQPSPSPGIRP